MTTVFDLQSAIEQLYQVFSTYPLAAYTNPCLYCNTIEDEAKLYLRPLRQLSTAELREYTEDALVDWGNVSDFKHFLPRIFQLYFSTTEPSFEDLEPEILFSKFRYGQWLTWPMQEQAAVRTFLHAVWSEVLGDPPPLNSFTDVQCWLCSIAQAEDDLEPYLHAWIDDQRVSASFALSSILLSEAGRNAFWDGRETQYAQLQSWKKSQAVIVKLEQACRRAESPSAKDEFEAALSCASLAP